MRRFEVKQLGAVGIAALCVLLTVAGLLATLLPALSATYSAHAHQALPASQHADTRTLRYTQDACTPVYAAASTSAQLLTELLGGTDVVALEQSQVGATLWQHVRIWSGIDGYIDAGALGAKPPDTAAEGDCSYPGVPDPAPDVVPASHGPFPFAAPVAATVAAPTTLFAQPQNRGIPIATVALGQSVTVSAWASDGSEQPWYSVRTDAGASGWLWSGAVRISAPNPVTHQVRGKPVWSPVAGKGMWFTNYLSRHADANALMHAAKLAGITHVYAEVAISQYGFYARNSLDRLLPAAHANGIAVISWVYPYLNDVAADVRMTQQVAAYVSPSGERADGMAMDVEEVVDSASVYMYGQVVRALLGPDALLVAAVYHPYAEAYYPYAAIAASFNVVAPMDYWHGRLTHTYTASEVERFVVASLVTVRAAMATFGADAMLPVEELGQTYDMYSGDGTGANAAPTGAEMVADMRAAKQSGCIGVSFFEWQTTTQDEWAAITAYRW